MTKETATEKIITIFCKLSLEDCIEVYNESGKWLHLRIEEYQKVQADKNKQLESVKEKLKTKE